MEITTIVEHLNFNKEARLLIVGLNYPIRTASQKIITSVMMTEVITKKNCTVFSARNQLFSNMQQPGGTKNKSSKEVTTVNSQSSDCHSIGSQQGRSIIIIQNRVTTVTDNTNSAFTYSVINSIIIQ